MFGVDFCGQLVDRIFIGDVSDHQSSPPVSLNELNLNIEGIDKNRLFLYRPLEVCRYRVIVWKIVSAGEALVSVAIKRTPQKDFIGVQLLFLGLLKPLVLVPHAIYPVFLNFGQDSV